MFHCWLSSSLVRHYPATRPVARRQLFVEVAQNEKFSLQVGVRRDIRPGEDFPHPASVRVESVTNSPWRIRVRRVGYVPMRHRNTEKPRAEIEGWEHLPGFVPDPLFEESSLELPAGETHAFWLSFTAAHPVPPGNTIIPIRVVFDHDRPRTLELRVRVYPVRLRPRRDFSVTNWFYCDALLDAYQCQGFDQRFWSILPAYLKNLSAHGQDTIYVPLFTPPLDGIKRPTQLLRVTATARGRYAFDWRDVKRYVDVARRSGLRQLEWTHLFTQWGVKHPLRIYRGQGKDARLLWPPDVSATGPEYREFLMQFLPKFEAFLRRERLMDCSLFHLSDEPHGAEHQANYRAAREMLRELAPWMKIMDALSEIAFAEQGLIDLPVASITRAAEFIAKGIPAWCYYCCQPRGRYLNRTLDDSLAKIRMNGWLFYRWPYQGFLHWGGNFWYAPGSQKRIDPFLVSDGNAWPGWPYGDPFMMYPGTDGPVDSIRWEIFAESLQDYALLQTLAVPRDAAVLQPLRSFAEFPRDAGWLQRSRRLLLSGRGGGQERNNVCDPQECRYR